MATFLSAAEIEHVTGKRRPAAQRRALDRMRVRYHTRPDGRPVVARSAFDGRIGEDSGKVSPDWAAIV